MLDSHLKFKAPNYQVYISINMYTHAGSLKKPTLPGLHPLWWIWSLSGANVRPQFSQGTNCAWALCQAASLNLSVYRKHTLFGVCLSI